MIRPVSRTPNVALSALEMGLVCIGPYLAPVPSRDHLSCDEEKKKSFIELSFSIDINNKAMEICNCKEGITVARAMIMKMIARRMRKQPNAPSGEGLPEIITIGMGMESVIRKVKLNLFENNFVGNA